MFNLRTVSCLALLLVLSPVAIHAAKNLGHTHLWAQEISKGNVDAAMAYFSEEPLLLPPNSPPIEGREAVRAYYQDLVDKGITLQVQSLEQTHEGHLGYRYTLVTARNSDGETIEQTKAIEIWRRVHGDYMLHRQIWNRVIPADD